MQKLFLPLYSRRDYYSLCCFIRASCTKSRLSWLMNDIIPLDNLQPRLAYPFSTRISTLIRDLNVLPPLILRKEASHVPCFWEQAIFHLFWSSLYSNIKKHHPGVRLNSSKSAKGVGSATVRLYSDILARLPSPPPCCRQISQLFWMQ